MMEHMFVFMKHGTNMHASATNLETKNIAIVLPPNEFEGNMGVVSYDKWILIIKKSILVFNLLCGYDLIMLDI